MSETKIHCINQDDIRYTNCGKPDHTVTNVGGYVFNYIKDEYQCKRCKKAELKRGEHNERPIKSRGWN